MRIRVHFFENDVYLQFRLYDLAWQTPHPYFPPHYEFSWYILAYEGEEIPRTILLLRY